MVEIRYHGERHTVQITDELVRHGERYIVVEGSSFKAGKCLHESHIVKTKTA